MEVYSDLIEVSEVHDGIIVELTSEDASKLRRACYFNKTIGERVAKRDGQDAGDEMHDFLSELGDSLADEGIERWDGREE